MTTSTPPDALSSEQDSNSNTHSKRERLRNATASFIRADRGQASQIGFIIIIVALLGLFTAAQVNFAPQVQSETEFEHASEVLSDYQTIHSNLHGTAKSGQGGSTVLTMGSSYPSYLILTHPPGPAGTLQTEDPRPLEVSNVQAVNDETAQYLDGSTQSFQQQSLRYSPQYHQFNSAGDSVIEQGMFYQDFQNSNKVVASPNIVEGTRISLIATTGDMNIGTTQAKLVETEPLSASSNTVIVEDDGDPIQIEFESQLSEQEWERILADEIDEGGDPTNNRYITDVSKSGDTVTLTLQEDETYEFDYAKIGYKLGEEAGFAPSEEPDVEYITTQQATQQTVQAGSTVEITVETRDRFSNPVSQVILDGNADQGSVTAVTRVSRSDGTATFLYEAPDTGIFTDETQDEITIEIQNGDSLPADQQEVTYEITVQE
jgi:hypothetical protein